MENECQLDSSVEEVEVRVTPVCLLRGVLCWVYCITCISTYGMHGNIRAVTVRLFKTYKFVSVQKGSIN